MINKGRNPSKVDGSAAIAMMVLVHMVWRVFFHVNVVICLP